MLKMRGHIHDQLDAYLEGLLDSASQEWFDQHLAGCRACRNALIQVREARMCLDWLIPEEAPPVPSADFYFRVEQSIENRLSRNWFDTLAGVMRPSLAYPLLFLVVLAAAWTVTYEAPRPEEGLAAIEYPATEFAQMAFTTADHELSEDLVMMNLVDLPIQ
jgi:hypothetical protein